MFFESEGDLQLDPLNCACTYKCCDLYCCGCLCPCSCTCGGGGAGGPELELEDAAAEVAAA